MNEGLLTALAPGLLALVVSRLFTPSERSWDAIATAVYGLALTVIANLGWLVVRAILSLFLDTSQPWIARDVASVVAQIFGIGLGMLLAASYKYNFRSRLLRHLGLPDSESVWLGAFNWNAHRYALLTLTNGQRVYGFVRAVSQDAKDGHILLEQASFSTPLETFTGSAQHPTDRGRTLLLRISEVSSVEFYGTIPPDEFASKGQSP